MKLVKFTKFLVFYLILISLTSLALAQQSNSTSKVEIHRFVTSGCLNWSCPLIEGSEYPEDCKALVCDYGGCSYLEFLNETLREIVESYYNESLERCVRISVGILDDHEWKDGNLIIYVTSIKIENRTYGSPPQQPSCISREEVERIAVDAGITPPFSCYPVERKEWIVRKFEREVKDGCGKVFEPYENLRFAKEMRISCEGEIIEVKENVTFCCSDERCMRIAMEELQKILNRKILNRSERETETCISREEAEEIAKREGFLPPYEYFVLAERAVREGEEVRYPWQVKKFLVKKFFEGNNTCSEGFEGYLEIACDGSVTRKEIKSLCKETRPEEFENCTRDLAIKKANEFLASLLGKDYFNEHFKLREVMPPNPAPGIVKYQVIYDVTFHIGNETYTFPTKVWVRGALGSPIIRASEMVVCGVGTIRYTSDKEILKYIPSKSFYVIITDEGERYLPIKNFPEEFRKDGLRVWFKGKRRWCVSSSIKPIEVLEIKRIEALDPSFEHLNCTYDIEEVIRTCKVKSAKGILSPINPFIDKSTAIEIVRESGFEPQDSERFPHMLKLEGPKEIEHNGIKLYPKEPRWYIYIGKQNHTVKMPWYNETFKEFVIQLPSAAVVNPMTGEIEDVVPLILPMTQPASISITTMKEGVKMVEKPQPKRKVRLVNERARRIISKLRIKRVKLEKRAGKLCLSLQARKTVRFLGIIPISIPLKVEITPETFRLEKPLWVKVIEPFSIG